ncbi:MAG: type I phosphomannose isomerase catalytic subunit [Bacteroidales bacterium]
MNKEDEKLQLYPLKFKTRLFEKPWGGTRIRDGFHYSGFTEGPCGEAWLLSAVPGNESVVDNGPLKGNTLSEVYDIFMEELTGDKVFAEHPDQFPILVKILDANEWLSVQVHPDDELARIRHGTFGKTEMWYIMDAEPGARLISGFDHDLERNTLVFITENGRLPDVVHYEPVETGDVFYTPAGRVHAIGPGILLAEIQQTSDITYRLYDWNRKDPQGKPRETHLSLALDAIDYEAPAQIKIPFTRNKNKSNPILAEKHFTTNLIVFDQPMKNDYSLLDSFVILLCTNGSGTMISGRHLVPFSKGEVILLPATTTIIELLPVESCEILEVFI